MTIRIARAAGYNHGARINVSVKYGVHGTGASVVRRDQNVVGKTEAVEIGKFSK